MNIRLTRVLDGLLVVVALICSAMVTGRVASGCTFLCNYGLETNSQCIGAGGTCTELEGQCSLFCFTQDCDPPASHECTFEGPFDSESCCSDI